MKSKLVEFKRSMFAMAALALFGGILAPSLVVISTVDAAQVQSRSIEISSSEVGDTGVTYKVSFKPQVAALSMVIDFCQNSPIIGAACTTTNGVSVTSAALKTGSNLPTGWALDSHVGSTLKLKGTTTALTASTAYTFEITGVANPTGTSAVVGDPGSFYARVYTYSTTGYGTPTAYSSPTTIGDDLDYGGFAMSTTNNISVTATVMETLTFCTSGLVSTAAPTSCTATSSPDVTLGSGTPPTIDSSTIYDNSAGDYRSYMILSTNALTGAVVNMKSNLTCNGLSSDAGATCGIPGQTNPLSAGTAGFGLKVGNGTGTSGTLVAANSYSASAFHMGPTGSATTYGDTIANTASLPCAKQVSQLTFGATTNLTTPAGVYTTDENLIATGTF